MKNNHLKLVVSNTDNHNYLNNLLKKISDFFTEPKSVSLPFGVSRVEKKQYILDYLVIKFADYQLSTGDSSFFPMYEAIKAVEDLEYRGEINSYYKRIKRRTNS